MGGEHNLRVVVVEFFLRTLQVSGNTIEELVRLGHWHIWSAKTPGQQCPEIAFGGTFEVFLDLVSTSGEGDTYQVSKFLGQGWSVGVAGLVLRGLSQVSAKKATLARLQELRVEGHFRLLDRFTWDFIRVYRNVVGVCCVWSSHSWMSSLSGQEAHHPRQLQSLSRWD